MNSTKNQKTTPSSHKPYPQYQNTKLKNMNLYTSSKKKHQSKSTTSNLDKYSPTNKQGHLYHNMHKRNRKITYLAGDQQKPSDFMTPEKLQPYLRQYKKTKIYLLAVLIN